jgi:hypothetical protein
MRKWGVLISLFYAVIVLGLIIPAASLLVDYHNPFSPEFFDSLRDFYGLWFTWFVAVILIAGEAILLFLTVDTSQKRLKPRTHIAVSYSVTAVFFALLIFAGLSALGAAIFSDDFLTYAWASDTEVIGIWAGLWLLWGAIFYLYTRNAPVAVTIAPPPSPQASASPPASPSCSSASAPASCCSTRSASTLTPNGNQTNCQHGPAQPRVPDAGVNALHSSGIFGGRRASHSACFSPGLVFIFHGHHQRSERPPPRRAKGRPEPGHR